MTKYVKSLVDNKDFKMGELLKVVGEHDLFYFVKNDDDSYVHTIHKLDCRECNANWLDNYFNGGKKTDRFDYSILGLTGLAFGFMIVYILIKIGGAL